MLLTLCHFFFLDLIISFQILHLSIEHLSLVNKGALNILYVFSLIVFEVFSNLSDELERLEDLVDDFKAKVLGLLDLN